MHLSYAGVRDSPSLTFPFTLFSSFLSVFPFLFSFSLSLFVCHVDDPHLIFLVIFIFPTNLLYHIR